MTSMGTRAMPGVVKIMAGISALVVAAGCAEQTAPAGPRSAAPTGPLPTTALCPGFGGDMGHGSPTTISSPDNRVHGAIAILAESSPARSTTVHAVVTSMTNSTKFRPGEPEEIVTSRIAVVSTVWQTIDGARGAPPPSAADVLRPANVIATSRPVRTTDLKDHPLVIHVPSGLAIRDYFVVAVQTFTELCRGGGTGSTEDVLGLVRITARPDPNQLDRTPIPLPPR